MRQSPSEATDCCFWPWGNGVGDGAATRACRQMLEVRAADGSEGRTEVGWRLERWQRRPGEVAATLQRAQISSGEAGELRAVHRCSCAVENRDRAMSGLVWIVWSAGAPPRLWREATPRDWAGAGHQPGSKGRRDSGVVGSGGRRLRGCLLL